MFNLLRFWILLTILFSCSKEAEDFHTVSVENSWRKTDSKKIKFNIEDPQTLRNLIFVVKHNNHYPFNNIFMICSLKDEKTNEMITDTLNYILAKPDGVLLGTGWGKTKEISVQYKNAITFPSKGEYSLEIKHGMRIDPLPGIESISLKITPLTQEP